MLIRFLFTSSFLTSSRFLFAGFHCNHMQGQELPQDFFSPRSLGQHFQCLAFVYLRNSLASVLWRYIILKNNKDNNMFSSTIRKSIETMCCYFRYNLVNLRTLFAHGFPDVPHLHCVWSQDKLAVRQGQPRPVPFFCFVLQVDLHLQ